MGNMFALFFEESHLPLGECAMRLHIGPFRRAGQLLTSLTRPSTDNRAAPLG